jgi:hypothetical protein
MYSTPRRNPRQVPLSGKLCAHYLASMGKIQGTLRISRLIDHRKCKSVITRQAQVALRRVPLNCLRISWLNLGSARSWRRFAKFFPALFVLTSIEVFSITYGALVCAKTSHLPTIVQQLCTTVGSLPCSRRNTRFKIQPNLYAGRALEAILVDFQRPYLRFQRRPWDSQLRGCA